MSTAVPWPDCPTAPVPTSFDPCCVHTPAVRVHTHVAPTPVLSFRPPYTRVSPTLDSATLIPCDAAPVFPVPTSFEPCCVHTPLVRVQIHIAPFKELSKYPPEAKVLPSYDKARAAPWNADPTAPVPTNFDPSCVHTPEERVNTHTAPASALSPGPPAAAVLPSADIAVPVPRRGVPDPPVPVNFAPFWINTVGVRVGDADGKLVGGVGARVDADRQHVKSYRNVVGVGVTSLTYCSP